MGAAACLPCWILSAAVRHGCLSFSNTSALPKQCPGYSKAIGISPVRSCSIVLAGLGPYRKRRAVVLCIGKGNQYERPLVKAFYLVRLVARPAGRQRRGIVCDL